MNVVIVSSELSPYARSGGLGDGVSSLARAIARTGVDVSVISIHHPSAVRAAETRGELEPAERALQRGPKDVVVPLGAERVTARVDLAQLAAGGDARPVRVFLVGNDFLFGRDGLYGDPGDPERRPYEDNAARFAFFCRAALEVIRRYQLHPHVVHCHDWPAALLPVYSEQDYSGYFNTILTIHDARFQGRFAKDVLPRIGLAWDFYAMDGLEYWGDVNFLKGGLLFASKVIAASPSYAAELVSDATYGRGLEGVLRARQADIVGIGCGVDPDVWGPEADGAIAAPFSVADTAGKARCKAALQRAAGLPERPDVPLLAFVGAPVAEKGADLLALALAELASEAAQVVAVETGTGPHGAALRDAAARHPDRFAVLSRSDDRDVHDVLAGADALLKPSRYEPCGRMQLRALRYGALPIVRATGGLRDTVDEGEGGVGFVFEPATVEAVVAAVRRAIAAYGDRDDWAARVRRAMERDHSWDRTAEAYLRVYGDVVAAA